MQSCNITIMTSDFKFPPDQDFWPQLMDIGTREPGIIANIAARLANRDARNSMRAANSASRALMNSCTRTVVLRADDIACLSETDLGCVFPNADSLELCVATLEKTSDQAFVTELLNHLASSSSSFLGRLRRLVTAANSAAAVCSALLPR
jgi:hypothetical protein